ncbi:MAG: type IV secretion system protein, partial [Gammaproteobacteria bacterium]
KDLFYGFLTIAIVWYSLWRAFDKSSFQESMPDFLKEFFVVSLFYAIMINAGPWLGSIVASADSMGISLGLKEVDPSGILSQGIAIGNLIMNSADTGNILTHMVGDLVTFAAYLIVLVAFCSVALDLSVTLILTTLLISLSGLLLAFAAFPFTRNVARKTLDTVIGNSVKLLCLYIIVASSSPVFTKISAAIPQGSTPSYDIFAWVVATSVLFWLIAKNIPTQIAKIVSDTVQENSGTDAAGLAMAAVKYAETAASVAAPIAGAAATGAKNLAHIAGSAANVAAAHFGEARASGSGVAASLGAAVTNTAKDMGSAMGSSVSDQFKKLAGSTPGSSGSIASQMHDSARETRALTQSMKDGTLGNGPSSSASISTPTGIQNSNDATSISGNGTSPSSDNSSAAQVPDSTAAKTSAPPDNVVPSSNTDSNSGVHP